MADAPDLNLLEIPENMKGVKGIDDSKPGPLSDYEKSLLFRSSWLLEQYARTNAELGRLRDWQLGRVGFCTDRAVFTIDGVEYHIEATLRLFLF